MSNLFFNTVSQEDNWKNLQALITKQLFHVSPCNHLIDIEVVKSIIGNINAACNQCNTKIESYRPVAQSQFQTDISKELEKLKLAFSKNIETPGSDNTTLKNQETEAVVKQKLLQDVLENNNRLQESLCSLQTKINGLASQISQKDTVISAYERELMRSHTKNEELHDEVESLKLKLANRDQELPNLTEKDSSQNANQVSTVATKEEIPTEVNVRVKNLILPEGYSLGACVDPIWDDPKHFKYENNIWYNTSIPTGAKFKFVLVKDAAIVKWENGEDRIVNTPEGRIDLNPDFGNLNN